MFDRASAAWQVVEPMEWPRPPNPMTFSSLLAIESCPRRWALESAQYPHVWQGNGYPGRFDRAAVEGTIIHSTLERITQALSAAGVTSAKDPAAPAVLRELGGFSKVIEGETLKVLSKFEMNPRVESNMDTIVRDVRSNVGRMRERAQGVLAQVHLKPQKLSAHSDRVQQPGDHALGYGSHPEIRLAANDLGWVGVADLINLSDEECEIVDIKTGERKPEHAFQLRIYSLLWLLDSALNPDSRPADRLSISYPTDTVDVEPLGDNEIEELKADLIARAEASRADVEATPPPARPSLDNCRYCSVRQLCHEYWIEQTQKKMLVERPEDSPLVDVETTVTGQHGATSWDTVVNVCSKIPDGSDLLVRTSPGEVSLRPGDRIRVLGGYLVEGGDGDATRIVATCAATEVYFVRRA